MSQKRPYPRASIVLRLEPEQLQALDAVRGDDSRNAWIEDAIAAKLKTRDSRRAIHAVNVAIIAKEAARPAYGSRLKKR